MACLLANGRALECREAIGGIRNVYFVAQKLHKSLSEILQMPVDEFNMWLAYFDLQREEQEQYEEYQSSEEEEESEEPSSTNQENSNSTQSSN